MINLTYNVWDPLRILELGQLDLIDPTWTEPVNNNGTLSGTVAIPSDPDQLGALRSATDLGRMLFVRADTGAVPWSGYITKRTPNEDGTELKIEAIEWRAYLYRLLIAPELDLSDDRVFDYVNREQLEIARDIVIQGTLDGVLNGVPYIETQYASSGVLRDLLVQGTKFQSIGQWIDAIALQDNGFEWDIFTRMGTTPQLTFRTWYPQRGSSAPGLEFEVGEGGNIISFDPPEETNEQAVSRQWAIGDGPAAWSIPYAVDDDPGLADNATLRFDKATSWSDANGDLLILAGHARAERLFYSQPLSLFSFVVSTDLPDYLTYARGDRCTVRVQTRWLDIDLDNVRIIQRDVSPDAGTVKLTVDLNDFAEPEADDGT